jgi:uncharacterized protein (DUF58 family)
MVEISREVFKHIRRIQIRTTRTVNDALAGAYHSAFKGRGMEFEDVRAYQPGDEVRSIDWNVTARMDYPYVKNYREERELTVMLVVDVSASCRFGSGKRRKADLIAEIGAVLAFSAIKNNDKVGLLLFSEKVEKYIPPKKGVRHVLRVIRELLVHQAQHRGTQLDEALNTLGKVQKKQGVCFLISDFLCDAAPSALAITAKRHDLISLCIHDPAEAQLPDLGLLHIQDLETGELGWIDSHDPKLQAQLGNEHQAHLARWKRRMERVGAGFIPLCSDDSYSSKLRAFFERREKHR